MKKENKKNKTALQEFADWLAEGKRKEEFKVTKSKKAFVIRRINEKDEK